MERLLQNEFNSFVLLGLRSVHPSRKGTEKSELTGRLGAVRASTVATESACAVARWVIVNDGAEHLTRAQKAQPEAELAELEGPKRAEVVQAIKTARGFGDLSENFEYHAAKTEQGLLERRITILRNRLHRAELADEEAAAKSGEVAVGSRVTIERLDDGEPMEVEISSVGGVSPASPLGKALVGAKAGDEVQVEAPRGSWRARVVSVGR